ncbi:hypothetical protein BP00DRAFT_411326 [Aspergillus indologenus CBS 114.80]|uniref:Uncharacterized protein n=1 Tax=Aspergillus indologenus CBS 114.80 TaxID=1450541 RepID=A0A2V5IHN6_9EURO|nr:hypothetical protein BP00DRAFT_411326 [Aspergillus indologenus CBS 114.80]
MTAVIYRYTLNDSKDPISAYFQRQRQQMGHNNNTFVLGRALTRYPINDHLLIIQVGHHHVHRIHNIPGMPAHTPLPDTWSDEIRCTSTETCFGAAPANLLNYICQIDRNLKNGNGRHIVLCVNAHSNVNDTQVENQNNKANAKEEACFEKAENLLYGFLSSNPRPWDPYKRLKKPRRCSVSVWHPTPGSASQSQPQFVTPVNRTEHFENPSKTKLEVSERF